MVWSGFTYGKRQFDKLPAGYIDSTDQRIIDTGYLDHAESLIINQGIGVMFTGTIGDVARVQIPTNAIATNSTFYGILVHDHAKHRKDGQALHTYYGTQLAPICRQGRAIRVRTFGAVTYGQRVYLIHTATGSGATLETPGEFKATQGSNSIEIQARFIETVAASGVASIELFEGTSRYTG